MDNGQFFLGYNGKYYYFSSGSFGISEQLASDNTLSVFNGERVEAVIKDSFIQDKASIYWENPLHDLVSLHRRNEELPFEMNIQFLYDIKGSYEYIDETDNMPIDDIIYNLLQRYNDDLYITDEKRRFTITRCDTIVNKIYNNESKELLADDLSLQEYYLNGDFDSYLKDSCWIVVSSCKVYDFQGFLPLISSREFSELGLEYFTVDSGIWIIEKSGHKYHMYRPDILYHEQDG